jgi:cytochrome c-type biogenesis protein CcmH
MRGLVTVLMLSLFLAPNLAKAVLPDEILSDPGLEARARSLSLELRCLVCQNQSIDDSNAELARDLRILVRERLVAGDTDAEALEHIRKRYGDFVLLNPPVQQSTYILWYGPILIVFVGIGLMLLTVRRKKTAVADIPLNDAERTRLTSALNRESDE